MTNVEDDRKRGPTSFCHSRKCVAGIQCLYPHEGQEKKGGHRGPPLRAAVVGRMSEASSGAVAQDPSPARPRGPTVFSDAPSESLRA